MSGTPHTFSIKLARWFYRVCGLGACAAGALLLYMWQKPFIGLLLLIGGVLTIWYSLSPDGNSVAESARTDLETLP
jgi:hypothetical protein